MPKKDKNEEILRKALERFEQSRDAESDLREQATEDVKFANDEQWDQRTLQERQGRPSLTVNKVAGTLKQIRGEQRKAKPSIKVRPVDSGADPEVAKVLSGIVKNIEHVSNAQAAYNTSFDQAIEGGWGFFRIDTDYSDEKSFEQDIQIKRIINPFAVYIDPSYTEVDASDMEWAFITETIDKEQFKKLYPKSQCTANWDQGIGEEHSDWFTKESVRVAEYFYKEPTTKKLYQLETGDVMDEDMVEQAGMEVKEFNQGKFVIAYGEGGAEETEQMPVGAFAVEQEREVNTHKVMWCKLIDGEVLEGPQEKPGKYIPIVLVPGEETYINGERQLKSAHRHAKDAQRVYNWMVSTAVETVSMAPKQPWLLTPDQIEGHEKQWNVAHRRPMPYLLYNPTQNAQAPSRQQGAVPDSGATNERQLAEDDIKSTTGIYDASLGAQGPEQSGRAIQSRQVQGNMSTFVFMDNLHKALTHAGRILVDLIPYIYDSERVVRILGPDGSEDFAEVNKTVIDMETGTVQTINDITQGRYDVVVDVGPSYPTQRAEAARHMLDFVKAMPQMGPMFMDLIAKHMDWPGSEEIYERLKQMQQQGQGQQVDPEKQLDIQNKQMNLQKDALDIEGKQLQQAKDVQDMAKQAEEMDQKNEEQMQRVAESAVAQVLQQLGFGQNNQSQQQRAARQNSPGGARS